MYINLLTSHRWTSIFRNYLKAFLTGAAPFYSGFATIFVSFNCQKWNHALYILFFVGIGTNSNFNCIPNPCASFFTILRLGFLVPFSIRLISACVIPVLADKSFCVIFCCTLASIIAWIISYSGCNASYSAFTSGFCNALFYNLYSYSLPYLRS